MAVVIRILYKSKLAGIEERPRVQGWSLKAKSIRGTSQLMVNNFVLF